MRAWVESLLPQCTIYIALHKFQALLFNNISYVSFSQQASALRSHFRLTIRNMFI